MPYITDESKRLFDRSLGSLIEGGSSASRGPANFGDYPIFMVRGEGARLFDADGNSYVDWMMSYGAVPLGHAHPAVVAAAVQGASTGMHFATATEIELEVAELIQEIIPSAGIVRFANTGTEAVMAAIRLARGFTGRPKILKFEGHYHGWYDDVLVSSNPQVRPSLGHRNSPIKIADSSGLNRRSQQDTIVVPWNDLSALERVLNNNPGRIAAVITEGIMANMSVIPPQPGYLEGIRKLTEAHDTLLLLDETVTGFRIAAGGCQAHYGITPDLSTFGKALGSGLPVAALVGRADIMDALSWGGVLHYGTQNASRIGMHVALASLKELVRDDAAAFKHTWELGNSLCQGLRSVFAELNVDAIVQSVGPMFQILFTEKSEITDYREFCAYVDRGKYQKFALALLPHGIYMSPASTLHSVATLAHSMEDVSYTIEAVRKACEDVNLRKE
ncbi:MAG TPA: aspartate aminotransferase family protein [Acidobacteriota bacterium]|nr:aspartate aminotransferase family protein [Acidobacteriota bacterium]